MLTGKLLIGALVAAAGLVFATSKAHASEPAKTVPKPHADAPPAPGVLTPDILAVIVAAQKSADPATMRAAADQLEHLGFPLQAEDLRRLAREVEAATKSPGIAVPPVAGTSLPPMVIAATPAVLGPPNGTPVVPNPQPSPGKAEAQKATLELLDATPYHENRAIVTRFQIQAKAENKYRGKVDGMYGPGTALSVASYGIVPVKPFYFSKDKSKVAAQRRDYKNALLAIALSDPQREDEWTQAAAV